MSHILFLDATDQLKALDERNISARALLEACVAQTDRLHGRLNAVVSRDLDRARVAAKSVDERRMRGEALGPLAGLPMTVKDAFDVEGLPASAGLRSLLGRQAEDAVVVRRARSAGAIIWGKTNLPVYSADWQSYNALYGTTNNPWDATRTAGGSSGGSAVALAAGMTALEIGADMGGSLRHPASFCGVFAHKPTYGLVPQKGYVPPVDAAAELDLAVIGPMARSARDLRLLLAVIAAAPALAQPKPVELKGMKVALWVDEPGYTIDPMTKKAIIAFAERLSAHGAIVDPIMSPVPMAPMMSAYTTLFYSILGSELSWPQRAFYEALRRPAQFARLLGAGPLSWPQAVLGLVARHREWLQANEVRAKLDGAMRSFFERYDLLLAPTSPVPAFPHNHAPMPLRQLECSDGRRFSYLEMLDWVAFATFFGLPATVIPAGLTKEGLPVGVQLVGAQGRDSFTLAVAEAIEKLLGGFRVPPAVEMEDEAPKPCGSDECRQNRRGPVHTKK